MAWSERDIADLTGAVAVITGGNGGLGLETTRELARNGAHVVMAARDQEKAAAAGESILGEVASASIEVSALDLASLSSVRSFASRVLGAHPSIDILVNNAGVMGIPRAETADGFEMQFGVNHLGHFVLTALLLPALIRSTGGRVVTVTSGARLVRGATIDPDDPHLRRATTRGGRTGSRSSPTCSSPSSSIAVSALRAPRYAPSAPTPGSPPPTSRRTAPGRRVAAASASSTMRCGSSAPPRCGAPCPSSAQPPIRGWRAAP